jgi:hypothetical protein
MTQRRTGGCVVATVLIRVDEDDQGLDPDDVEGPVDWVYGAVGAPIDNRGEIVRVMRARWARKGEA